VVVDEAAGQWIALRHHQAISRPSTRTVA
jgi:hypothetical protein